MLKSNKTASGETVYSKDQSFYPVFITIAAFMLVSVLIMVFSIKENKELQKAKPYMEDEGEEKIGNSKLSKPVFKSLVLILLSVFLWFMAYNAVTTAFSRYCVNIWGADLGTSSSYLLTATVAAIAAFVPLGFLSAKVGRKSTVLSLYF